MSLRHLLLALALAVPLAGCPTSPDDDDATGDDDDSTEQVDFRLWSPDFVSDENIDHDYDCDQALPEEFACLSPNPEIRWEGAPEGTESFVLIFDDISPQYFGYPHWAILNIPADAEGLEADISGSGAAGDIPAGSTELDNGFGEPGYVGSCPAGDSHYQWRLWALDTTLEAGLYEAIGNARAAYEELAEDAEDASLEMVSMCHVYES